MLSDRINLHIVQLIPAPGVMLRHGAGGRREGSTTSHPVRSNSGSDIQIKKEKKKCGVTHSYISSTIITPGCVTRRLWSEQADLLVCFWSVNATHPPLCG